jgi:hypothetical protein
LRLELTGADWANAGLKADVASFLDDPHHAFVWQSTGLLTHNFENLVLVVDGQVVDPNPPPVNHAPVAADDRPVDNGGADIGNPRSYLFASLGPRPRTSCSTAASSHVWSASSTASHRAAARSSCCVVSTNSATRRLPAAWVSAETPKNRQRPLMANRLSSV